MFAGMGEVPPNGLRISRRERAAPLILGFKIALSRGSEIRSRS
jgi:hypothetical protein